MKTKIEFSSTSKDSLIDELYARLLENEEVVFGIVIKHGFFYKTEKLHWILLREDYSREQIKFILNSRIKEWFISEFKIKGYSGYKMPGVYKCSSPLFLSKHGFVAKRAQNSYTTTTYSKIKEEVQEEIQLELKENGNAKGGIQGKGK